MVLVFSDRLFVVAGSVVEILNLSNPASPSKIGDLAFNTSGDPDGTTAGGFTLIRNSVAVGKVGTVSAGIVAVAIAVVDIATATVESILPLGVKDYNSSVNTTNPNALDASDRDVNGTSAGGGKIAIQNWPVFGIYQPDAIASYTVNGQTYYVTANEGDTRDYTGFSEEVLVSSLNLDPTAFPDGATLKLPQNLGRLLVTNTLGDTDGDGDYDQIYTFGARSFTIWDSAGKRVYDSGADFERITAAALPKNFNSNNDSNNFDNRSDNKGPEPEGVVIVAIANRVYAFIGLERVGGVVK